MFVHCFKLILLENVYFYIEFLCAAPRAYDREYRGHIVARGTSAVKSEDIFSLENHVRNLKKYGNWKVTNNCIL